MPELVNWELLKEPYNWIVVAFVLTLIVFVGTLLWPTYQQIGYGPLSPLINQVG